MQNLTHFNKTANFIWSVWFTELVMNSGLLAVSTYLLAALIFHKLKVEKPQGRFFSLSLEKRYGVMSTYICILIGIFSVIRQTNDFVLKSTDMRVLSDKPTFKESTIRVMCDIMPTISIVSITIGSGFVYLFLWFRQRVFYVHPSLKVLSNKVVKFISYSILAIWFICYASLLVSYLSLVRHRFKRTVGCRVEESAFSIHTSIIISSVIVSIVMQIGLLFLFLNPMFKSSLWRNQQQNERNTSLLGRVKKAIILALICLATDVLTIALTVSVPKKANSIALPSLVTNLVINHLVTVACFDHWRKLLWPWGICLKNVSTDNQQKNISTTPTSNNVVTLSTDLNAV